MNPRVFIASTSEQKDAAYSLKYNIEEIADSVHVTVWNQNLFVPGRVLLENLLALPDDFDWAVLLFTPDDVLEFRGDRLKVVRDNLLLELGLFMGRLGRDRTIVVMPSGVPDMHLPSDLGGLLTVSYDATREDLDAALGSAALRIKRAISNEALQKKPSAYLRRYVERNEPPLLLPDLDIRVTYDRGYQILLDMFENEHVDEFCGLDLAFPRWAELLHSDAAQTRNTSRDIFYRTGMMFEQGRCRSFRRILVVTDEQLHLNGAKVLRKIDEHEEAWRREHPGATVETRVLPYPPEGSPEARKIANLQDFALFKGEAGHLAIVEPLSAPTDSLKRPKFSVVTREETTRALELGFEELWKRSHRIQQVLKRLAAAEARPEDESNRPAVQAFNAFLDEYRQAGARRGAITLMIEAAYFDLRAPDDKDRFVHLDEAFFLLGAVQGSCPSVAERIFLDTFINDYTSCRRVPVGPGEACVDLSDTQMCEVVLQERLLPSVQLKYEAHGIGLDRFARFPMRKTRNAVARVIKRGVRRGNDGLREVDEGDTTVNIYADTPHGSVLLGWRDTDSHGITPRCTALMAQHYFDLYRFAVARKPDSKELWIFDFNRYIEQDAVRLGAEATLVLHPWPRDFRLRIVNCNYAPDGSTGSVHITRWPR